MSFEVGKRALDFLVENYAKKGVDVNKLVLKEMTRSTNLNDDQAFEEVIAQSCESLLRDIHLSDKTKQLYKTDKGLATKIKNILNRILNAVKKWYGVAKPQSIEANYVLKMKDALSEAYDKYIAGIRAASQNLRNMEKPTNKGGAKLQARYSDTADILNDFNIPENKISDYIYVQKNVYNTLLKDGFFDKSETVGSNIRKFRTDVNAETGMVIETGRRGIKETFNFNNYGKYSKQLKVQKLAVIRSLPEIIQNGHMIADDVANYHNDDSGVNFAYIQADIELNGDQITVKVAVKKSPQRNSFWVHSIEAKEKSTELDPSGATPDLGYKSLSAENNVPQSTDIVKRQSRSDADYLSAVKRGDMKTAQRMVDEAAERAFAKSKIRDEDGKLMKVYHGTDADFTVFDRAMGRANMDIQGMFFSPWDIDAGGYGSNVRAFDSNSLHRTNEKRKPHMGLPFIKMVETIGIEPMTPCTSSRYSNQLS